MKIQTWLHCGDWTWMSVIIVVFFSPYEALRTCFCEAFVLFNALVWSLFPRLVKGDEWQQESDVMWWRVCEMLTSILSPLSLSVDAQVLDWMIFGCAWCLALVLLPLLYEPVRIESTYRTEMSEVQSLSETHRRSSLRDSYVQYILIILGYFISWKRRFGFQGASVSRSPIFGTWC